MTAQLGIDVQAAVSVGAMFAPSAIGRWLATISHRSASGRSWAKESCTVDGLRNASASPSGAPGVAGDVEHGRRVGHVERRARSAEDLEDGLADVGDERVDVDERLDVAAAGAGVRDHDAAVRVADEDDGAGGALGEERRDVRGVAGHAVQQVRRGQHGEALGLQLGGHGVPARAVGPGSVDEDDRRLRHGQQHRASADGLLDAHAVPASGVARAAPRHEPVRLDAGSDADERQVGVGRIGGRRPERARVVVVDASTTTARCSPGDRGGTGPWPARGSRSTALVAVPSGPPCDARSGA